MTIASIRKRKQPQTGTRQEPKWDDNSLTQITRAAPYRYTDRGAHVIKKELAEGQP